ncbi:E3 ubiquitin-protein ligase RNF38-like isoform X2 [Montipora capricornis]|uniref:E3 ubiquitin-protein ligase RNF38-like isoform X2 n=1 Tax=Montipora capricornis TaxID=246305 RepID=UPI0035F14D84
MARELIPSLPAFSALEHTATAPSCSNFVKSDIKPNFSSQVIDLTSEGAFTTMSHQPLRHMPPFPPHPQHSSAFHRVNHPPESHGSPSNHGCPYLQQRQQRHHHPPPHNRLYHPPTNGNFCPLSMGSTVPLQHHPPHPRPPVIIDVDQIPDHVRALPVTSLPNSLLVANIPVAAPTYIQPHQPQMDVDPSGSNGVSTHHHHHYHHHHHHHHHHFVQPPYQVPQGYHPYPPTHGNMHHRHSRRWHHSNSSHSSWSSRHAHPAPQPSASMHPYPDLLYHLISVMSMQPVPSQPSPPAWEEELHPRENYETLLNFAEQMGEAKPKGLSRIEIDQLRTYRVTAGSKEEKDNKRCVVCLVDFEEKQLVRVLPCLHEYHTRCIDKWLKSNRTCPICRAEVNVNSE